LSARDFVVREFENFDSGVSQVMGIKFFKEHTQSAGPVALRGFYTFLMKPTDEGSEVPFRRNVSLRTRQARCGPGAVGVSRPLRSPASVTRSCRAGQSLEHRLDRPSGLRTTDQLRTRTAKLSAPQRSIMDTSDNWFMLDSRGGLIWGSRGREFKSRQPDKSMSDDHTRRSSPG
jgi:hypothetical protein